MNIPISIHVTYNQNIDLTWDSSLCDGFKVLVKDSKSLEHARVITDIMLSEEYTGYKVMKETINYY